jgi:NAD(P)-dependent dehydrogenase (short-subunit alcohol dehydrogenase family)
MRVAASPASGAAAALLLAALLGAVAPLLDPLQPVPTRGAVIISGASTGIGRDAAEHLARRHAGLVVLAGVRRAEDAAAVRAAGLQNLVPVELDVRSAASVAAAVAAADATGLPLVAVVCNAGLARGPTPVEYHDVADAQALFDVNVFGALRLAQAALPRLRESRGRVVLISSIFGAFAPPMGGVYAASKRALEALGDALRIEARALGVSVSIVQPGAVRTPIFATLRNASLAAAAALGPAGSAAVAAYPHLHTAADVANEVTIELRADSTACTSEAVEHAVTSARPRTRYLVANIMGAPAWLLAGVVRALPDRLGDWVLSQK